jgi:carbamoyltransferase
VLINQGIGILMKKNSVFILGINFLHSDASACLFRDGVLIAASEEERFTRIKHTASFPERAIIFCLKEANLDISDINFVTINSNPLSGFVKKLIYLFSNFSSIKISVLSLLNTKKKISIKKYLDKIDLNKNFKGKIKFINHHESHIASSVYFSNFSECANLSIDGFGDFSSSAFGFYADDKLKIDSKIYFPHSLGIFYQSLTQFLGFKSYGDEYKVMGLSSYGKPKYFSEISKIVKKTNFGFELNLKYFIHHKKKIFHINDSGQYIYKNLYSKKLIELLGPERHPEEKITQHHFDLARSIQEVYEDVFFHLINKVYEKYKVENLTISGGCAMNSLANGKIDNKTKFKNIYVSPNPGDAGGAIGSACIFIKNNFNFKIKVENYSYLGSWYTNDEILTQINKMELKNKFKVQFMKYDELYPLIAKALTEEKIIGWFQGKMEWGPRALGNRSILADPRNVNIKNIINSKIKRRESFRPFAPSIMREHVGDWFVNNKNVPYMSEVQAIKKEKRILIPGVTHVDGSGRLQSVLENENKHYYRLIKEFYKITGVPIILNTSFNENEPIVNDPIDAINCYKRTNMDILVLGNWVISR